MTFGATLVCLFISVSIKRRLSTPDAATHPHSITLPPTYFTDGKRFFFFQSSTRFSARTITSVYQNTLYLLSPANKTVFKNSEHFCKCFCLNSFQLCDFLSSQGLFSGRFSTRITFFSSHLELPFFRYLFFCLCSQFCNT